MTFAISELELVRSITKQSFFDFVREHWDIVVSEKPVWNWHIKYLCDQAQKMSERVFAGLPKEYDMIINVPPGSTKSLIFSVMLPAWQWARMPAFKTLCGSHAFELGMDLSRKCRDIILEPSYVNLYDITLRDDQNAKGYFMNNQLGYRKTVTVGGKSPVGFHAHMIIVDDPIDPQKAISEVAIKAANQWMNEVLPSRKVDKSITPTILVMQRLHQNDPTGNWLSQSEHASHGSHAIKHICLPGDSRDFPVHPSILKRYYKDGLLDPVRMPREILEAQKTLLGMYGYAGQIGQSPVPLGGGMFKTERIQIDTPPPSQHFKQLMRFWDKAGTAGGGAYTVGLLMGEDRDGVWWILDVIRGQWDSAEREQVIKTCALSDGVKVIIGLEQEPGSGGKESAESTIRNLAGFTVRVDRPTGDKAQRADPLSTQCNAGNLKLARAGWNAVFLEEYKYFPASTYKDQVDAGSGAFNFMAAKKKMARIWS